MAKKRMRARSLETSPTRCFQTILAIEKTDTNKWISMTFFSFFFCIERIRLFSRAMATASFGAITERLRGSFG